jgi:ABC-type nitrate/sulfonate/bicarbonate transport system substrate-binding protein
MRKFLKLFITLFFSCLIITLKAAAIEKATKIKDLKIITLLLDWKPNTNHLGFYVAKRNGYYAQYGILLKILNPSLTTSTALIGMGKADFGISYANNLIYARNANIPIVSLAGILQNDTSCFVWRKSTQIKTIKDLEGKRYGGWGSPEENATLKYIMEKNGSQFSKVKILTTGNQDFLPATLKNVDFTWEYKAWNILAAKLKKVPVDMYCPSEHFQEINKPSPLIIANENMIKNTPDLVKNFMKATSLGYEYAIKNPEEAAVALLNEVPELDAKLVHASALILAPLYQSTSKKWGFQNEERFKDYSNWMKKVELIKEAPKTSEYINNNFLP